MARVENLGRPSGQSEAPTEPTVITVNGQVLLPVGNGNPITGITPEEEEEALIFLEACRLHDQNLNRRRRAAQDRVLCTRITIFLFFLCIGLLIVFLMRSSTSSTTSDTVRYTPNQFDNNIVPKVYEPDYSWDVESCVTVECKNAVEEIVNSLNKSVDPCENFFEFACQGWQGNNPRPDYSPDWNVFTKIRKKTSAIVAEILQDTSRFLLWSSTKTEDELPALRQAKIFYQSCVSATTTTTTPTSDTNQSKEISSNLSTIKQFGEDYKTTYKVILKMIKENGGWPLLAEPGTWDNSTFDLTASLVTFKTKLASPIFFDVISKQSPTGILSRNTVMITTPSFSGSLVGTILEKEADNKAFKSIYALKDFIVNVSRELLEFEGKSYINETYLEQTAWEIIFVQSEVQGAAEEKVSPLVRLMLGISKNYLLTNTKQLQLILDTYTSPLNNTVRVDKLLDRLYYDDTRGMAHWSLISNIDLEPILVQNVDYLLSMSRLLTEFTKEALANYVMFQMVSKMIPYAGPKMQKFYNELKYAVEGTSGEYPREEACVKLTQEKFALAVGQAYVKKSTFNHFAEIKNMFNGMKQVFTHLIRWSTTPYLNKTLLLAEMQFTELCLGYPSWILDNSKVEKEYAELSYLSKQNTFLEKLMAVNKWSAKKQLQSLRKTRSMSDGCNWPRFAGTIGAFSEIERYLVYLPLGMLQNPFYNVGLPKAINYGRMGSILGHEIIHGLVGPGWSQLNNGSLTTSSECLVNQYGNFTTDDLQEANVTIDGKLTLNENIPDNAGLLGAYNALKKATRKGTIPDPLNDFTEEQLFFIGFAQNWCHTSTPDSFRKSVQSDKHGPGMFRVLGTLQNSKAFAEAWKCPVGSKMNLDPNVRKKCTFF